MQLILWDMMGGEPGFRSFFGIDFHLLPEQEHTARSDGSTIQALFDHLLVDGAIISGGCRDWVGGPYIPPGAAHWRRSPCPGRSAGFVAFSGARPCSAP